MKHILIFALIVIVPMTGFGDTKILFLGDSITAGYGVDKPQCYPALIEKRLTQSGITDIKLINAGISGSTSASALSRLKWYKRAKPDVLFLALGGNDGLRGLPIKQLKKNLSQTIQLALDDGIQVILAGMIMPPNYGQAYTNDFKNVFIQLAVEYPITFMPFLLKDVAGHA